MKPYYEDDAVTIYHGDCRDVLPSLGTVDHVITDPPYSEETHVGARSAAKPKTVNGTRSLEAVNAFINFDAITFESLRAILGGVDVLRWVVMTSDWRHVARFAECPPDGLRFVRFGVWVKPDGAPQFTGDRPATGWEAVGILHAAGGKMRWNGGGKRAVWTHNIAREEHPTAKPLSLLSALVADFTDPGDLILDPFGGSGTTARAAKDLGRRCILIEREERWCEIAAKRMAQTVMDLAL